MDAASFTAIQGAFARGCFVLRGGKIMRNVFGCIDSNLRHKDKVFGRDRNGKYDIKTFYRRWL